MDEKKIRKKLAKKQGKAVNDEKKYL